MKHFLLLSLLFVFAITKITAQVELPQAIIVPTGSLGEVSEIRKKILEKTLKSFLDDFFAIVPKDLFEEAEEKAFEELDYEECTEEQCIILIKEMLQVEHSFQLVLMAEGETTFLSLNWKDLDRERVEEDVCENCDTIKLRKSVSSLVDSFSSDFQKIVSVEEQNEIEELSSTINEDTFSKYETTKKSSNEKLDNLEIIKFKDIFHESKNKSLVWYRLDSLDKRDLTGSIKYCNALSKRGFSDWSLPNRDQYYNSMNELLKNNILINGNSYWTYDRVSTDIGYYFNIPKEIKNDGDLSPKVAHKSEIRNVVCARDFKKDKDFYEMYFKDNSYLIGCSFFGCEETLSIPVYKSNYHIAKYKRIQLDADKGPWTSSEIIIDDKDKYSIFFIGSGETRKCNKPKCKIESIENNRFVYKIGEESNFNQILFNKPGFSKIRKISYTGELMITFKDWGTWPPQRSSYQDNSGYAVIDIFLYETDKENEFNNFLRDLKINNPNDANMSKIYP